MADHGLEGSEQLNGIPVFICLSVCLRKDPCEQQQDPAHSIMDILEDDFFLQDGLFSLFTSLLHFMMSNIGACLVLGSVLESMDSNPVLNWNYSGKKGLKTYDGTGGLRYIFSYVDVWFPRQKYREIQSLL